MKFVGIVATALYFESVDASLASLNKGQKQFQRVMGGNNRNLMLESVATLNKYGCWCFFEGDGVGNGKGSPKDFIDTECRDLHRAYTCAAAEIPGCEPWSQSDVTHGAQSFNAPGVNGDILKACEHANRFKPVEVGGAQFQACIIATCAAETKFLQNVNTYLLTEDARYPDFTHDGVAYPAQAGIHPAGTGTFNQPDKCKPDCPKGTCFADEDARQCCGDYPERYPFKVHAGDAALNQQCCGPDWTHFMSGQTYVNNAGQNIGGTNVYATSTHRCVNNVVVKK